MMRQKILGSIVLILVLIAGYLIFYSPKSELTIKKPDLSEKTYTIIGKIQDASMNLVTVKTEKGSIYSFSLVDVDTKNILELQLDHMIQITYHGVLDTSQSLQTGIIKKIEAVKQDGEDTYPVTWNDNGLFKEYYKQAYETVKTMTMDEKIGQLLLVRVPESSPIETVTKYQFGGYILFGRDIQDKTKEELIQTLEQYQSASKIPMIIATDEEGGIVNRVSTNANLVSTPFLSSQDLYQQGGYDLIAEDTIEKSNLLFSLGINMNLAPVADVSTDSHDYIYRRSFGQDAKATAKYIQTVVKASKQGSVAYTLKHFPGYGNNKDTHTGISLDNRRYESFVTNDFLPFLSGIQEGIPAILVSHNIVASMEDNVPASLSKNVHNILREQLGFTGIIMTDDLAMDAIYNYEEKPAVKAILSGNDMLIVTDYDTAIHDIDMALKEGKIGEDTINHLVFRILAYKYYMNLI